MAVRLIKLCLQLGIPGYLENPRSSRLFRTPGVLKLVHEGKAIYRDADLCQFGVPYKKPTRVLFWGIKVPENVFARCTGSGGRCSKTGHKHINLRGKVGKRFLTTEAAMYPESFARAISNIFL